MAVGTIQRIFSAEYRGEQNEEKCDGGRHPMPGKRRKRARAKMREKCTEKKQKDKREKTKKRGTKVPRTERRKSDGGRQHTKKLFRGIPRRTEQRKSDEKRTKKSTKKKATGFAVLFGRGLFYKGGDGEDLSPVGLRVERVERHILLWSYASNDYI